MRLRSICCCLMPILLLLSCFSVAEAEVGYVNILNGIEPAKAFLVERLGRAITPKGVYTNLEKDDVVKPLGDALLLFTPSDTACEAVEIREAFTATSCPPPPGGLKDAAYDFVANEFLAAKQERVGVFATRGEGGKRVHSLPPRALRLFVESSDLAGSLKKTPFIALTGKKSEAEALILGQGSVQLLAPGEAGTSRFQLPAEESALRHALLRRINFKTMAELASPSPWPMVEWNISIYAPSKGGTVDYDDRKWSMVKTVKATEAQSAPIAVKEPCLLTFYIANRSAKPYYAYLVNYTGGGQILPVLPPKEQPVMPNLVAAGAELPLAGLFLELGEAREFVRLILSENPLDLGQFNQENLDQPDQGTSKPGRLRPAPANSWFTTVQAFTLQ